LTAKQLENDTGCKIMVRGKGSMRDKQKVLSVQQRCMSNFKHVLYMLLLVLAVHIYL